MLPLEPGQVFSHYRIVAKLGEGGMGEVYRAVDLALDRPVAIKLLPPGTAGDSDATERFLREARAASALNHPNIVTVYAVEQADGRPFIAMELVEGETLRERLARGPVPLRELIEIGLKIADALDAAHAARLVHRDLKPSNVILTPRGEAKLLDFGLAKRFRPAGEAPSEATRTSELTTPGTIIGTVAYMSPEQSRGERLDPRTDLFSLGSVLYEAATGCPAFAGPSTIAVLHEIATRDPDPPSAVRPGIPYSFDLLIARALSKDRDRRYASAAELMEALRTVQAELTGTVSAVPREAAAAGPNNLPVETTSFVGRAREVAELKRLIAAHRLVTVTGPGGCGKTRLALRVARDLLSEFPDGVWMTELAGLSDPALVPQAVTTALGLREEAERPIVETICRHLRSRTMLLLLDNCEHMAEACGVLVGSIVASGSDCRVLATSREPLGAPGEVRWLIPALSAPSLEGVPTADRALQYESVRLFVARAAVMPPSFTLTDSNAPSVAEICRQLDGIPLAIELAAARVNVLPVSQILARLRDRFRLLTTGGRAAFAHQQTLRAAVDWSYEFLTPQEQALFNRLSVFAGGLTLEAAETVCSGGGVEEGQVLDLLARLADKSLIVPEEGAGGSARYRLLETLRQYGRERLERSGESRATFDAHARFYMVFAEAAEPKLKGAEQSAWLEKLEEEHDNLRQASEWVLQSACVEESLRLTGALWRFYWFHGHLGEGRRRLEAALSLDATGKGARRARAKALLGAGALARTQCNYERARMLLQEGLSIGRLTGNQETTAGILLELGNVAVEQGRYPEARAFYEECLGIRRVAGDQWGMAVVLHNLGSVAQVLDDYDTARSLYAQSLALTRENGNRVGEAAGLDALGSIALDHGDYAGARHYHEEALAIHRQLGYRYGIAYSLRELGRAAIAMGDRLKSHDLLAESLTISQALGDRLADAETLEQFAVLAAAEGQDERALVLAGAAAAVHEALGAPLTARDRASLERSLTESKRRLGPPAATSAFEAGRAMPLDRAIGLATGENCHPQP